MRKSSLRKNEKLKTTFNYLCSYIPGKLDFGIILGSFLNKCINFLPLVNKIILNFSDIPNMHIPTVSGHEKFMAYGKIKNKKILIFSGRLHFYEGYSMREIVYPIEILSSFSTGGVIITNSAGGLNPAFNEDDIMLIEDHINFMFDNPLFGNKYTGKNDYFLDMSCPYDKRLSDIAKKAAEEDGVILKTGIYAGVKGPILETKSEINVLRKSGADAVGMSTIPEVIMANFLKIDVLGLSHIRNIATPSPHNYSKEKKFRHIDGRARETLIGKRLAKIIENILKKS